MQRDHGIHSRGAVRWDVTGEKRRGRQHQCEGDEGESIHGHDAIKRAGHQARQNECDGNSDREADGSQAESLTDDHL